MLNHTNSLLNVELLPTVLIANLRALSVWNARRLDHVRRIDVTMWECMSGEK
jgi:hypothetical protein